MIESKTTLAPEGVSGPDSTLLYCVSESEDCLRAMEVLRRHRIPFLVIPGPFTDGPILETRSHKYRGVAAIEAAATHLDMVS